ncbi:MAG: hypothetical protein AAFP04_03745 [Myxococcota bacterium]
MTRTSESNSETTIDAIVDAVSRLVGVLPIVKISFRRVASEAGVGLGTVTYYFPTRERLLEAALEHYYRNNRVLRDSLIAALQSSQPLSLEQRLSRIARTVYLDFYDRRHWLALEQFVLHNQGGHSAVRREYWLGPSLDLAASALEPLIDLSASDIRIAIQSLIYSAVRFATMQREELAAILGVPASEVADGPEPRVEEHFGRLAVGMFCRVKTEDG